MSAENPILIRRWSVGDYTVTLRCQRPKPGQAVGAFVEWDPTMPKGLTATDQAAYLRGRDEAIAQVARMLSHPAPKGPKC